MTSLRSVGYMGGRESWGERGVSDTCKKTMCVLGVAAEGLVSMVWMTEEEGGGSLSTVIG